MKFWKERRKNNAGLPMRDENGRRTTLCLTLSMQIADAIRGRMVLIWRDIEGKGYRADFEDGRSRLEDSTIAGLVNQLKERLITSNHLNIEVNGGRALSDTAREEIFDLIGWPAPMFGSDCPDQ